MINAVTYYFKDEEKNSQGHQVKKKKLQGQNQTSIKFLRKTYIKQGINEAEFSNPFRKGCANQEFYKAKLSLIAML